ncbi:sugar phosphate nucleotidyltransferase [Anaeroselena agilis]|uniref:Glucose-1-phosphate thymidylyltransferase n=1 Tax=Anaeroselena agilis TaxID=3063788 RepID=A0ABU3NSD8_9FIRM|nr:sugar phosphate nucleotidyltransferase [Selenomonadales bacterium 4137-cl]
MKGIVLAGGKGTRLDPITEITNKHLLPVGKEPMIWHAVKQLVHAGIHEILIVTSTHHMGDIVNSLGSGKRFGCEFTFRVQEDALGIAHALMLGERFANGEPIVVFLGDNIFELPIRPYVEEFSAQPGGARVLLKQVGDPERYGVAALDERHVIAIEEKPSVPKSSYAVVGCYMYDDKVFDYIRATYPSARQEYEITAVNNLYIKNGQLRYSFVKGRWTDAGTFESLNEANQLLLSIDNKVGA